jgi:hypothetical protein
MTQQTGPGSPPAPPAGKPEKTIFRIEYNDEGDFKFLRPHRSYHGFRGSKGPPRIELDLGDDDPLFAAICDESEGFPGRSVRVPEVPGLVLTATPEEFGSEADRRAAGKMPFKQMVWGEFNLLGDVPT